MKKLFSGLLAACAVTVLASSGALAQQAFKSPEEAASALVAAVRANDAKAVARVLGAGGNDLLSSGDKVADTSTREAVLKAYDAKNSLTKGADGRTYITVGTTDYPIPLPIVEKNGSWRFDTVAGREEILYRRIGRNELSTIEAMLAYVDAQNEYAEMAPSGGIGNYAQRIVSRPGKKDGLYWPAAQGEPQSPLGEAVAAATRQGYRVDGRRNPFHGYYFQILTRQGPTAPGGAVNYVANGKMIGGFALVAWPAQYGNSGVMTFVVNHKGEVFQKDLGPRTGKIAPRMTAYNPDRTWQKVVVLQEKK